MAKRMIDTALWNNEEIIENFTAEDKYFWLYVLTSPHVNILGVFKNSPALIARDMGLHKDTAVNLLYRFEKVHGLLLSDNDTNEVLILNWYKFNWTKSETFTKALQAELVKVKSAKIAEEIRNRINGIDTVSIRYTYRPNHNNINSNNTDKHNESDKYNTDEHNNCTIISDTKSIQYFDTVYAIYPRKVSKIKAKEAWMHKFVGLEINEAKEKATKIWNELKRQILAWQNENDGEGRKIEHIPHFSTWCNANVEDSPHFKRGKRK